MCLNPDLLDDKVIIEGHLYAEKDTQREDCDSQQGEISIPIKKIVSHQWDEFQFSEYNFSNQEASYYN